MKKTSSTCLLTLVAGMTMAVTAHSQGTFQNLDFEAARIIFTSFDRVGTTNALPGWMAFSGTNELFTVPYNNRTVPNYVGLQGSNDVVISGSFSVLVEYNGSLSQTGLVPAEAQALLFKARAANPLVPSTLLVSLEGQDLAYTVLASGPDYTLYGADIAAFAGQMATLSFARQGVSSYFIDDIQFAVPEPSTLALVGVGGFLFAAHRLRRRRGKF